MKKREFFKKHGSGSKDKACSDALNWIASLPKTYNGKQIWHACKRSDWMLWYLKRTINNYDPKFRLLACAFVRRTPVSNGKTAWDLLTDERSKRAVEVAELYAVGKATKEELTFAAADVAAAANDAAAAAVVAANAAATNAAAAVVAANAAANAAAAAVVAANAAVVAANAADAADAANAANAAATNAAANAAAANAAATVYAAYTYDAADARDKQCHIIREFFPEP